MRHVSQNVNQNVYGTGSTFGKIDPLGQAHVRRASWSKPQLVQRVRRRLPPRVHATARFWSDA